MANLRSKAAMCRTHTHTQMTRHISPVFETRYRTRARVFRVLYVRWRRDFDLEPRRSIRSQLYSRINGDGKWFFFLFFQNALEKILVKERWLGVVKTCTQYNICIYSVNRFGCGFGCGCGDRGINSTTNPFMCKAGAHHINKIEYLVSCNKFHFIKYIARRKSEPAFSLFLLSFFLSFHFSSAKRMKNIKWVRWQRAGSLLCIAKDDNLHYK